jgi:hypothetical protein
MPLSEWKPFVTVDLMRNDEKPYRVAIEKLKNGEKLQIWPYDYMGKTYYVAIYAKSFMPFRFHPEGFLSLTKNGTLIKDKELCQRIAKDFVVWQKLYHHPPFKYVPKKYFEMLREMSEFALENCKKRQEEDRYNDDQSPSKRVYNEVLKKLDLDVIRNTKLILTNLTLTEQIISMEKTIWQRCSFEKMDRIRALLPKYEQTCLKMAENTRKRGELFYEYEKAIKEAYKIDLQITKSSFLSKASMSFLLWLANAGLLALAIPFLPDILKLIYQELVGHKSLLKSSREFVKKAQRIASLAVIYNNPVDSVLIRNF